LEEFRLRAQSRLLGEERSGQHRKRRYSKQESSSEAGPARTARRSCTITRSVPSSGPRSKSPGSPRRKRTQQPTKRSSTPPPAGGAPTSATGLSSSGGRAHLEHQAQTTEHRLFNTWEAVARKYGIDTNRYEEFEYACYLDSRNCYTDNFVKFHIGTEEPLFENRLADHVNYWKNLNTPDWLLHTIEYGLQIPFERKPPRMLLQNSSIRKGKR
jgi:hypothetical protein